MFSKLSLSVLPPAARVGVGLASMPTSRALASLACGASRHLGGRLRQLNQISASRHLGGRGAAYRLAGVSSGSQLAGFRRFASAPDPGRAGDTGSAGGRGGRKSQETPGTDDPGTESSAADSEGRTWGDKIVVLGLALRGAAFLPQLAHAARFLRFAGTGPMLLGVVVSAYEIGGWRLILGAPATAAAFVAGRTYSDGVREEEMKLQAIQELRDSCPDMPGGALDALRSAPAHHYESNCIRMVVQWPAKATSNADSAAHFRIELECRRDNFSQPWSFVLLRASSGAVEEGRNDLPPQTRNWDSTSVALRWTPVWQRQ